MPSVRLRVGGAGKGRGRRRKYVHVLAGGEKLGVGDASVPLEHDPLSACHDGSTHCFV